VVGMPWLGRSPLLGAELGPELVVELASVLPPEGAPLEAAPLEAALPPDVPRALIASTSWLLRRRATPGMPMLDARLCSSGSSMALRPVPRRRLLEPSADVESLGLPVVWSIWVTQGPFEKVRATDVR